MEDQFSNILLFKTNIGTPEDKRILQPILDLHPLIEKWSVDLDDVDCVLRIISCALSHTCIIDMIRLHGYRCEELKD